MGSDSIDHGVIRMPTINGLGSIESDPIAPTAERDEGDVGMNSHALSVLEFGRARDLVAERAANLKREALVKRAPDERTKTVTDETPVTSTIQVTGAATTQTITTTSEATITSTPPPVTAAPITITAKQQTKTKQVNLPVVVTTQTRTFTTTIVNTATTTASGAAQSCASRGGVLLE